VDDAAMIAGTLAGKLGAAGRLDSQPEQGIKRRRVPRQPAGCRAQRLGGRSPVRVRGRQPRRRRSARQLLAWSGDRPGRPGTGTGWRRPPRGGPFTPWACVRRSRPGPSWEAIATRSIRSSVPSSVTYALRLRSGSLRMPEGTAEPAASGHVRAHHGGLGGRHAGRRGRVRCWPVAVATHTRLPTSPMAATLPTRTDPVRRFTQPPVPSENREGRSGVERLEW